MFTQKDLDRVKRAVLRKYEIAAGLSLNEIDIKISREIDTACVVVEPDEKEELQVKEILVNPDFFAQLTFAERVFVLAHEAFHIALRHIPRAKEMPEKDANKKYREYCKTETDERKREFMKGYYQNRYHELWNIATDACINAFLIKDGLTFPEDVRHPKTGQKITFINMEEGLYKSAEKIYKYLVEKEEEKEKEKEEKEKTNQPGNDQKQGDSEKNNGQIEGNQNGDQEKEQNDQQQGDSEENDGQKEEKQAGDQEKENKQNKSQEQGEQKQGGNQQKGGEGTGEKQEGVSNAPGQNRNRTTSDSEKKDSSKTTLDDVLSEDYTGLDSHKEWSEGGENTESQEREGKDSEKKEDATEEEELFVQIEEARNQQASQSVKRGLKDDVSKALGRIRKVADISDAKVPKPILPWKRVLVGHLEQSEYQWGLRRASRFNPNSRIEERTEDKNPSIEIILDTSGSVSEELLRGFLLQLIPIVLAFYGNEEVSIKVGCFGNDFSGFTPIRNVKDVKKFQPSIGGGTDFEVAARSFTKDPSGSIRKIVFTDGVLGNPQVTRVPDILWVVFGSEYDFKPVGGRIVKVSNKECSSMISDGMDFMIEPEDTTPIKKVF